MDNSDNAPSWRGYAEEAPFLLKRYEARDSAELHAPVAHCFPAPPADILDIGSGTGRDAGYFAGLGHRVWAVEPTAELREPAKTLHPSGRISWIDDALPDLAHVRRLQCTFDLIMLTAVWMHLDSDEQARGMKAMSTLAHAGTRISFYLRHGPVPKGRRMFDVGADETIALGTPYGFAPVLNMRTDALQADNRAKGISWTRLILERTSQ